MSTDVVGDNCCNGLLCGASGVCGIVAVSRAGCSMCGGLVPQLGLLA